jgi:hypothetical protein
MQRRDVLNVPSGTVAMAAAASDAQTDELAPRCASAGGCVPLDMLPPQPLVAAIVCMWMPSA